MGFVAARPWTLIPSPWGLSYVGDMSKRAAKTRTPADSDKPDLRPIEGLEADCELAALAKAVGHPTRVAILRLLTRKNACICGEIVEELPLAQSTVSQHLKVLKQSGLVQGEVDGPTVCYCVSPSVLRRLKVLVAGL